MQTQFNAPAKLLSHDEIPMDLSLASAATCFGNPIRVYDDGIGPLWVLRETLGVSGIVRAQTWEEAFECCQDAIMNDADPNDPDSYARSFDPKADEGDLAEGVYYRPNGEPTINGLSSPLCYEDLNGCLLDRLTGDLATALEITVTLERN